MAKALVVYATITGNNEDVADIITEALENQGIEVEETEMTMADAADFEDVDICVVCPYTYDEGALPDEGLDFFDDLKEEDLSGKVYGVAGSGDTFYEDFFCLAVDKFGDKFSDLAGSVKKGADTVKKSADQAVNHFTNDDFDEQTAQIREELAKAQSDTSSQDDIVIDKTPDASDEDNDAASQDDHSSSSDQD